MHKRATTSARERAEGWQRTCNAPPRFERGGAVRLGGQASPGRRIVPIGVVRVDVRGEFVDGDDV